MASNPYADQLASFRASVPNARRGLRDIYKLRAKHFTDASGGAAGDLDAALAALRTSTAEGLGAMDTYTADARALVGRLGYEVDPAQTSALGAEIEGGVAPLRNYTGQIGGLRGNRLSASKQAFLDFYRNAQEGLARERPAAESELESGILDMVGMLGQQSSQFQAQQQLMTAQQQFMSQSLAAQGVGGLSPAEQWLIQHESGGRTTADNPKSTAFGLGQLLIANRRKYAAQLGVSPDTTDYRAQLEMMRRYVRDRYGSAEAAMRFWQANGWY